MEMYQLEFHHHYQRIGVDKIKERVRMILDNDPEHMIMFAAI
jgi:DNA primase